MFGLATRQRAQQGIQRHIRRAFRLVQFLLPRGLARGQVSMVACLQQPLQAVMPAAQVCLCLFQQALQFFPAWSSCG